MDTVTQYGNTEAILHFVVIADRRKATKTHKTSKTEERRGKMPDSPLQDLPEWKKALSVVQALPPEDQYRLVQALKLSETAFPTATQNSLLSPFETLKKTYKPFPHSLRMNAENIIAHLKTELKDYVRYFGADNDYIYLDEFGKIEKRLSSINSELSKAHKINRDIPIMADMIPKKTVRTQKEQEVKTQAVQKAIKEMEHLKDLSFTQSFSQQITEPSHI